MPDILQIGYVPHTVLCDRDFLDLVEEYMGYEARSYAESLMCAKQGEVEESYKMGYEEGLARGIDLYHEQQ